MIQLLEQYSLSEILIFTIYLALAVKGLISFFSWIYNFIKNIFHTEHSKINEKEKLQERLQRGSEAMAALKANQEATDDILKQLSEKIDMLIESDRDDIKAYITERHHYFCYQVGWIDDFSLECLEKRFQRYEAEGGNSFIGGFMEELRNLPKQPLINNTST